MESTVRHLNEKQKKEQCSGFETFVYGFENQIYVPGLL
jgi:hypothetical protein